MMQSSKAFSIRIVYVVNMLPIIGLMAYYYTRFLEGTYSFILPLGLTFLWMVLSMMTRKVKGLLINPIGGWWMVYLFLCVMMVIIGFSSTNLNFFITRLPFFIIPSIGYFVVKHYNRKEKTVLLTAFALVYAANLIYNIILGKQMPDIFEQLSSKEESLQYATLMNIANTGFIVVGYWLIGALLMAALLLKERLWRMLCILFIVTIGYYMLFQNTRGTAILLLIVELVGLFLAYFEPSRQANRRAYYLFSVVFLILLAFIVFIPIMSWLMQHLQSERLADRLNDLVDFRQAGGNINNVKEGSFTERLLLAQTSLNSFLSSPISILIGIGDHTQAIGMDLVKSGIGNHSEFIDVLGRYGLVGAFVFLNIMKSYYRLLRHMTTHREILKYVDVIFVVIILSGFLNNIFYPAMEMFLFMIYPIIIELTNYKIDYASGRKEFYRS